VKVLELVAEALGLDVSLTIAVFSETKTRPPSSATRSEAGCENAAV
jgi:hypothetical protein